MNYQLKRALTSNFQSQPTQIQYYPQQPMIMIQPEIHSFDPQTIVW